MLARSGLVGKNSSRPHLGQFQTFFPWAGKIQKNTKILPIFLGGPMGPIHPFWGNGCNISSAIRMGWNGEKSEISTTPGPHALAMYGPLSNDAEEL